MPHNRFRGSRSGDPPWPQSGGGAPPPALSRRINRDIRPILCNCSTATGRTPPRGRRASASTIAKARWLSHCPRRPRCQRAGVPNLRGRCERPHAAARVETELTDAQKDTLRRWIAEGAAYEPHWAFQTPSRPDAPHVPGAPTPIDAFIRARLAEEGLSPAPEAPKETLIRRVALDLTGLPPTLEEIDAFLADTAPDAYERMVDSYQPPGVCGTHAAGWTSPVTRTPTAAERQGNLGLALARLGYPGLCRQHALR